MLIIEAFVVQIFRKEPFFYGHDNSDQLVKIAKVCGLMRNKLELSRSVICTYSSHEERFFFLGC